MALNSIAPNKRPSQIGSSLRIDAIAQTRGKFPSIALPKPHNGGLDEIRRLGRALPQSAQPPLSGELMLPTSQTVIFLLILLALQYLTMLNKGASFLPRAAFEMLGEVVSWESAIIYVLGVTVAGIALGILVFHRYEEIDRWYAAMILAGMAGHLTCVLKYDDRAWRDAYLKEQEKKARSVPQLGLDKDEP
jgi:hypothetical protein